MANTFSFERVRIRVYKRTCACVLNFQVASHTRLRAFASACVGSFGFAYISGLLRVHECHKGRIHRANASRMQTRFCSRTFRMYYMHVSIMIKNVVNCHVHAQLGWPCRGCTDLAGGPLHMCIPSKQSKASNTPKAVSCLGWDSNPQHTMQN